MEANWILFSRISVTFAQTFTSLALPDDSFDPSAAMSAQVLGAGSDGRTTYLIEEITTATAGSSPTVTFQGKPFTRRF